MDSLIFSSGLAPLPLKFTSEVAPAEKNQACGPHGEACGHHGGIPLFSDDHYVFMSKDTHWLSGVIALSPAKEIYVRAELIQEILAAVKNLGIKSGKYWIKDSQGGWGEKLYDHTVCSKATPAIEKICPPDGVSKEDILAFYKDGPTFEFKVGGEGAEYEIKPVLVQDRVTDRYYLHIEMSRIDKDAEPSSKIMLNFFGNSISQGGHLKAASRLLRWTGVKQIIPSYANKGINRLLNPDLSAATTSIKGSINPHLLAYNHLTNYGENVVDLEIYAHSYGNLAAAQFINRVREVEPTRPLFFIGSATASSLLDVAKTFVGETLAGIADTLKLLNHSDVYGALNQAHTTSIIFNNVNDPVIQEGAQIQTNILLDPNQFGVELNRNGGSHHWDCVYEIDEQQFKGKYNEYTLKHYPT